VGTDRVTVIGKGRLNVWGWNWWWYVVGFFQFFSNFIDVHHVPLQLILHAPVLLLIP
jgi:hypothetical protein